MKAVTFEGFLARKFPTEKRFGLEGCESFIPSMNQCLETSAEHGRKKILKNYYYSYHVKDIK